MIAMLANSCTLGEIMLEVVYHVSTSKGYLLLHFTTPPAKVALGQGQQF